MEPATIVVEVDCCKDYVSTMTSIVGEADCCEGYVAKKIPLEMRWSPPPGQFVSEDPYERNILGGSFPAGNLFYQL